MAMRAALGRSALPVMTVALGNPGCAQLLFCYSCLLINLTSNIRYNCVSRNFLWFMQDSDDENVNDNV